MACSRGSASLLKVLKCVRSLVIPSRHFSNKNDIGTEIIRSVTPIDTPSDIPTTATSSSSKWTVIADKLSRSSDDKKLAKTSYPGSKKGSDSFSTTSTNILQLEGYLASADVSKAVALLYKTPSEYIDFKFIKLVLLTCGAACDEAAAEKCLEYTRNLGIETSPGLWDALLAVYGESGNCEKALSLLKKMESVYRVKLSTSNFNKALKAASRSGNFIEAKKILSLMQERQIPQDSITFSTYVQSAVNAGRLLEACQLIDEATQRDQSTRSHRIPSHAFHHIMYAYGEIGKVDIVDKLFKKMIHNKTEPDLYTFSILFSAHGKFGNRDALNAYIDIMLAHGIRITHRRAWKSLKGYFQNSRDIKLFSEVFRKLQNAGGSESVMPEILRDYITMLMSSGNRNEALKLVVNLDKSYSIRLNTEDCNNFTYTSISII